MSKSNDISKNILQQFLQQGVMISSIM